MPSDKEVTDQEFTQAIKAALRVKAEPEIAEELRVTTSTVKRWSEGRNLAHPEMRRPIMEWAQQLEQRNNRGQER